MAIVSFKPRPINETGTDGDDVLLGSAGADTMSGGAGSDTYYVNHPGDVVVEPVAPGNDRVSTSISYALPEEADIELFEAINSGAGDAMDLFGNQFGQTIVGNQGANILKGNGGNDELHGLGGNDFLVGGTGSDAMYGGAGNDTYYVDAPGDAVTETAGQGLDRVAASSSFVLLAGVEVELLEAVTPGATNAMNLTGNEFSQTVAGNNGANVLRGEGGNDILIGYGGDDALVGGDGNNNMAGGTGNDTYYVGSFTNVITEAAGEGTDRVATGFSLILAAGAEIELIEVVNLTSLFNIDITGNEFGQTLVGNNGANWLDGKGGNDVLVGAGDRDGFTFTSAPGPANADRIADFLSGTDTIALDRNVYTDLVTQTGPISANIFVIGTAARDSDDHIIYNNVTGQLFYDRDADGPGAALLFATLDGHPTLVASDIIVF